jgi:biopolymer transport protein ExbD
MRFYLRKRRQPPAVIIVALIDVLIVVLIFLMVTTSFKQPQYVMKLKLPESSQAVKTGATEAPPLVVTIESDGNYRIGSEARPVTLEQLKSALVAEARKNPQLKLTLTIDTKGPWGRVVKAMDAAREANIKNLVTSALPEARP